MIKGTRLTNIPWESKPPGRHDVVWRYSKNPIIGRNPIPSGARAFNSAVVAYQGAFVGVFRVDHRNTRPSLHFGKSEDAVHWELDNETINWVDEKGRPAPTSYAYDPRLLQLDDAYYITWCDDFPGPSIGLGKTRDFKTFTRLENATMPFNRNGVLFPRKINGTLCDAEPAERYRPYAFWRYRFELQPGFDLLGKTPACHGQRRQKLVAGHQDWRRTGAD
jgi:beta-1,4-mannooligosaccharide/beta-1,4-mannosyl-N-acetylglucosamine phosphorylase